VLELFATAEAMDRHPELVAGASQVSDKDAAALSETVTPQGLVAVCSLAQPSLTEILTGSPKLLAVVVEPNEPGNLGTIIRTADAAGADAVLLDGGVDPYNGKAVRASAGSLFHLPVVSGPVTALFDTGRFTTLATTGGGWVTLDDLLDDGTLDGPVAWFFGNEARGLPSDTIERADHAVRVPIYGGAESLNLAATAAVCLYASARQQRRPVSTRAPEEKTTDPLS